MNDDLSAARVRWWKWLPRRRYAVVCTVPAADLIPHRLPRRGLAIVDDGRGPAWIAFDCPCRRRHRLLISLSEPIRPYWHLTIEQRPSLTPSVNVSEEEHRCHFWLKNGSIQWVGNSDQRRRMKHA